MAGLALPATGRALQEAWDGAAALPALILLNSSFGTGLVQVHIRV